MINEAFNKVSQIDWSPSAYDVTESSSIAVGLYYCPPGDTEFFDGLEKSLEKAWLKHKNLFILGDFNVNFNETTSCQSDRYAKIKMDAILKQFNCVVVNTETTRETLTIATTTVDLGSVV